MNTVPSGEKRRSQNALSLLGHDLRYLLMSEPDELVVAGIPNYQIPIGSEGEKEVYYDPTHFVGPVALHSWFLREANIRPEGHNYHDSIFVSSEPYPLITGSVGEGVTETVYAFGLRQGILPVEIWPARLEY